MRGNLLLLATCQALGQAANTMMFAATALSVSTFLNIREYATLPVTMQHVGIMAAVFPAALLMQRMGRRFGFRVGSLFGMLGATVAGGGLYLGSLAIMCLGGFILGYAVASLHMYRFAAVELVNAPMRAKAISWVTAGGIVSAAVGPALVNATYDLMVPVYLATYATMFCVHLGVFVLMGFIGFAPKPNAEQAATAATEPQRSLWQIGTQPAYVVAVLSAMVAYGTMSFLMSASPLAIVGCGLPQGEAHLVIFMHVMGMFVPALFTGNLIQKFGTLPVMMTGAAILILGIIPALIGEGPWNFRIALTLNGIGWNFMFVGATALVTTTYRMSERGKAQALNDFLIFGTTAISSFMAAFLEERLGWAALNWIGMALIIAAVAAVGVMHLGRKPAAA
jgi:MFS family permease